MCTQISATLFVMCKLFLMLSTIELDHYFLFDADEIGNVLSDGMLAAKTMAIQLSTS